MATKIWVGTGAAPNDWTHPDNWSPSGVPSAADHVYFENNAISCNTASELDQSSTGALGSLNIAQSYTGSIGTSATPLKHKATLVNIGYHNGPGLPTGSPLINLDLHDADTAIVVSNTGTSADTSVAPLRIKAAGDGTPANSLIVYKGKVEVGTDTGDTTTTFLTITSSYVSKVATDADLFIGVGSATAVTTLNILGGDVFLKKLATTVNMKDGTLHTSGSGAIATLNVQGGVVTSNSTGTIGALNIFGGSGTVDFTKSNASREVTATKLDPGGILKVNSTDVTSLDIVPYTATTNITYTAS